MAITSSFMSLGVPPSPGILGVNYFNSARYGAVVSAKYSIKRTYA